MKTKKNKKSSLAELTALYYGFQRNDKPKINADDERRAKIISKEVVVPDRNEKLFSLEEVIALLRFNRDAGVLGEPQASLIYYEQDKESSLHILNGGKSVSDVMLLRAAEAILEEHGKKEMHVWVNSLGCKQAWAQFLKETNSYFRKNSINMNPVCRQAIKKDVLAPLICDHKECLALRENAPEPMDYLNEEDRKHFKEVLEYLEALKIPYEIKPFLFGDPSYSTNTVFEIHDEKENILAVGTRYNSLTKKIDYKKEVPCAGIRIFVGKQKPVPKTQIAKFENPKFHFVQIGFDAKIQSLILLDELRKAKVPVLQALNRDRISTQLQSARVVKTPYVIIMGQKEALEGTVMVRDAQTRAQKTVFVRDLANYLKELITPVKTAPKKSKGKK